MVKQDLKKLLRQAKRKVGSRVVTPLGLDREPPTMSAGHMQQPEVLEAIPYVHKALMDEGTVLGQGNFGKAVLVDGRVVKLPAEKDIHGRKWEWEGPNGLQSWFRHEAGTASELHDIGIVPDVVYVQLGDIPFLVREYGELPGDSFSRNYVTDQDYVSLELGLIEMQRRGWDVSDELLVMRRPDGSLFIADAGFWFRKKVWGHFHPDWVDHLRRWTEKFRPDLAGLATLPELESMVSMQKIEQKWYDRDVAKGEPDLVFADTLRRRRLNLLGQITKRRAMGLPVPDMEGSMVRKKKGSRGKLDLQALLAQAKANVGGLSNDDLDDVANGALALFYRGSDTAKDDFVSAAMGVGAWCARHDILKMRMFGWLSSAYSTVWVRWALNHACPVPLSMKAIRKELERGYDGVVRRMK